MYPKSFQKLINQFAFLPGIGPKMAERLVLFLFKQDKEKINEFIQDLENIKNISSCKRCFNIAQNELCTICSDENRNNTNICIVEEPLDIIPIERSHSFNGIYHVLGGTIKKRDTDNLTIAQLIQRVETEKFQEILIATNFTTEGDMTAMHLTRELKKFDIKITRLARGLATGSDIEYADDITIRSAITNRESIS
ncbi:MAG: recombination protein RecR [Candidatus Moraniibacteriota bacterium]|nr:MAG: recombination protein RecR [Candidatus Moranbacteria bacterium]